MVISPEVAGYALEESWAVALNSVGRIDLFCLVRECWSNACQHIGMLAGGISSASTVVRTRVTIIRSVLVPPSFDFDELKGAFQASADKTIEVDAELSIGPFHLAFVPDAEPPIGFRASATNSTIHLTILLYPGSSPSLKRQISRWLAQIVSLTSFGRPMNADCKCTIGCVFHMN